MQMNRLTSSDFDKMIIESIDEVLAFDRDNDELLFMFDQIISGEITSENETIYAEGRQGVQLASFDRNKTAGFTCENGYVQAGAIATQLGSDIRKASASDAIEYEVIEIKEVAKDATTLTLAQEARSVDNVPVVKYVYLLANDGSKAKTYTFADEASESEFTAATADKVTTVTLPTGLTAKDKVKVMVQYEAESTTGQEIINAGDKYSSNVKLVINFVAQEPCGGNKYLMQCVMPNAKVSGTFSLSVGDSPAVQNFEASALLDVCSVDKELFVIKMV